MVMGIILLLIGFFAGAYGIMVGAGGGFVFVPAILILLHLSPEAAAGTGLVVVFINSISGVYGYVRQKRIDYKMGLWLALGATPGTFLGIWLTQISPGKYFNGIFAVVLIALGLFLILKKTPEEKTKRPAGESQNEIAVTLERKAPDLVSGRKMMINLLLVGLLLGVVSSFFGIGGGWLLVPILVYLFRINPHYATAISIFSLCLYSALGVIIHIFQGNIDWVAAIWGGIGILFGAQLGVYLSSKVSGRRIIQMLAVILIAVGVKLFF